MIHIKPTDEEKKRDERATHWHQGCRAHDANAPRTASECIPDANVRRQWLDGWDAATTPNGTSAMHRDDRRRVAAETEKNARDTVHLLSPVETARFLGVSTRHLRSLNASGRLPAPIRLGGCVRWSRGELLAWCDAGAPAREAWDTMKGAVHEGA